MYGQVITITAEIKLIVKARTAFLIADKVFVYLSPNYPTSSGFRERAALPAI